LWVVTIFFQNEIKHFIFSKHLVFAAGQS